MSERDVDASSSEIDVVGVQFDAEPVATSAGRLNLVAGESGLTDDLCHLATVDTFILAGDEVVAWAELHDGNPDMLAQFEESYLGEFADPADWARELLDSDGLERSLDEVIPESLRTYVQIHYDDFVEDARLSGDLRFERAPNGNTWIFRVI